MIQSRILIKDTDGNWRKVVGVRTNRTDEEFDLYLHFPQQFRRITGGGQIDLRDITNQHIGEPAEQIGVGVHDIHLRYPINGRVHFTGRNRNDEVVYRSKVIQHEPMEDLTPAKRIFTVIPKSANSYPVYENRDEEHAWRIGDDVTNFFEGNPVYLNFWIGSGEEEHILSKIEAIRQLEMRETRRPVLVYGGQDDEENIQLFLAVTRPQNFNEFPNTMRLAIHPPNSPRLRRRNGVG